MADVITRFKLETTQFDSKLREASKSLSEIARTASLGGSAFDSVTKSSVSAAKAFGDIATGANNSKDKVKELVGAFNTVANAYNSLTKEQQQSDFGKALAESMEKLKGRVAEAKQELYSMGESGKDTGGMMDMLASKLTVNIDAMKLFNVGLQAASKALDVAKDAFFNSEEQLDEWGRIVESSTSLYNGFLNALNTGDISGFIDNIGNIVQAARSAYDALDALSTFNAFNQINVEKTRTNLTESIASYREGSLDKESVKAAGDAYKKELSDRKRLEREAYIEAVGKVAAERGVSKQDLLDALSGNYGHYQDLKKVMPTGTESRYVPGLPGMAGRYDTFKVAQNDQERLGDALRHLNDTELQSLQALGAQAERTGNEIAQVDKQLVRVLNGRQGGSGGGGTTNTTKAEEILPTGSVAELTKQMQELRKEQSLVTNAQDWKTYEERIKAIANYIKGVKGELGAIGVGGLSNATGVSITGGAAAGADARQSALQTGKLDFSKVNGDIEAIKKGGKDVAQSWKLAASAVGTFGNMLSSLKDPAAQIGATVAQAIASVALAYANTLAKDKTSKSNIWAFIAASAAAMVSMATTISQIHSSTGYAGGGKVEGTHFSGDMEWARLNAGETVLTQAQTGIVASALQQNGGGNFQLETSVSGDDLRIILRRGNAKRGYGTRNLVL